VRDTRDAAVSDAARHDAIESGHRARVHVHSEAVLRRPLARVHADGGDFALRAGLADPHAGAAGATDDEFSRVDIEA
jgi:hypothetical protein